MFTMIVGNQNRSQDLIATWLTHYQQIGKILERWPNIILVDYGSTETYDWPYLKSLYRNLKIHQLPEPLEWNRSRALNYGAKQTTTEGLLLFTDLDLLIPYEFFEQTGKILAWQASMSDLLITNRWTINIHQSSNEVFRLLRAHRFWGNEMIFNQQGRYSGGGGVMMLLRSLFYRLGGFDETYRLWGGEDSDLIVRCTQNSIDRYDLKAPVIHINHPRLNLPPEIHQANQAHYEARLANRLPQLTPWES